MFRACSVIHIQPYVLICNSFSLSLTLYYLPPIFLPLYLHLFTLFFLSLSPFSCLSVPSLSLSQFVMELTFTQAAKGVNKEMTVNLDDACQRCDGKGSEPGTKVQHCHYCNGTGMVSGVNQLSPLGTRACVPKASHNDLL